MKMKDFPLQDYLSIVQQRQENLRRFYNREFDGPLFVQFAGGSQYAGCSNTKEASLDAQLDALATAIRLHGDAGYYYLEPWHGCGVYATAFGAEPVLTDHTAMQTLYCYDDAAAVENVPYPDWRKSAYLLKVLDTIRYFQEETGGQIPISVTDTQSPNDTASLILDACELFAASLSEPETVEDFLQKITDLIAEFTQVQIDAIGSGKVAFPGHSMLSDPTLHGISLSDDNMASLSPVTFASSSLKYIAQLAKRFGSVSVHSCGVVTHVLPMLLELEGLTQVEVASGYGDPGFLNDPNPNDPKKLAELFLDRDVILATRMGPSELERIKPLLNPRIRLIVQLVTHGTVEERNLQFDTFREAAMKYWNAAKSEGK